MTCLRQVRIRPVNRHPVMHDNVARLQDPAFRRHRAEISLSFARGEFDPAVIQQQLSDSLTSHV